MRLSSILRASLLVIGVFCLAGASLALEDGGRYLTQHNAAEAPVPSPRTTPGWTSAEVAAADSIEGQLRSERMRWVATNGEICVGAYVQDTLEGRLDQPEGRGAVGRVVSLSSAEDGKRTATVDFGRGYSVGISFSELRAVSIVPGSKARAQSLNIDFGVWKPNLSTQTGPAAAGSAGDFWNAVAVPWDHAHTESGLKHTDGSPSPLTVTMLNLGGAWSSGGRMGVKSPMLDTYNYPANNRGGNSRVILEQVPTGKYDVYIYGHGLDPNYYGDYTITVGEHSPGRKTTYGEHDAGQRAEWIEGSQYVRFSGVKVSPTEDVEILIRPGARVTEPGTGRRFADAMICGLQLVRVE